MAGDWIKIERATLHKPEILLAAELLGMKRREAIGLFVEYFGWLDENMRERCNGLVTHVSRKSIEEALQCVGFAAVLERIGWASFDDEACTLVVINAERHNGKTAKSRALANARVKRFRNSDVNGDVTPERYQRREEKRVTTTSKANPPSPLRGKSAPLAPPGVAADTWAGWVSVKGKKLTLRAYQEQVAFLADQPDPDACVRQSLRNTWAGLFPLKTNGHGADDAKHQRRAETIDGLTGRRGPAEPRVIEPEPGEHEDGGAPVR